MADKTFQCPNCGSPITTTGVEKEVTCAYCGSTVIVPKELRDAPPPQPQPMPYDFGSTSQPNPPAFQEMVTADKVAKATIGFTAASFILPIILTCVILAAVGGILFYVFSNGLPTSAPTDTPVPTPSIPTPAPFTNTLFSDDFSSPSSGWPRSHSSKYTLEYKNNQYHVLINQKDLGEEVNSSGERNYSDISVEADAELTAGPNDGLMGVTCRDDNNGDFYSFEFSQDGTYGIYKYSNGNADSLDEETLDPNTVHQNEVNHIEGVCGGETLTLILNGRVLLQEQDSDYTKGTAGLIVRTGSSGDPGEDVLFSNFAVKGP
ncbi:MAG TPA: hypothetical protein VLX61_05670 [Anaerolineales bacterium]|nr:hypothetical protein [Anaerolineales bacterium]